MAVPVWPATLPQCPLLNGWDETPQPSVTSFIPEVGPPKARRRSTAKVWISSVTYRMSNAQILTFLTFYETTLEDGSLPFSWDHPITNVIYNWQFDPQNRPRIARIGPKFQSVSFNLLRLP